MGLHHTLRRLLGPVTLRVTRLLPRSWARVLPRLAPRLAPRIEPLGGHLEVHLGGVMVAEADSPVRVVQVGHRPTYYLPRESFRPGALRPGTGESFCPWKGVAEYFDVVGDGGWLERSAAWTYPRPGSDMERLTDLVAVEVERMDRVTLDGRDLGRRSR